MVVPVMAGGDLMEADLGVAVLLLFGLDEDDGGPRADHSALPGHAQRSVDVVAGHHDGAQVGALRELREIKGVPFARVLGWVD